MNKTFILYTIHRHKIHEQSIFSRFLIFVFNSTIDSLYLIDWGKLFQSRNALSNTNLCRRKSILQQVISAKDLLWYCTLWETCKPYFSNKHARGDSKVMLIENDEMLLKNEEVAKEFNQYFGHRRATRNFSGQGRFCGISALW